jgi:hypothetical protein
MSVTVTEQIITAPITVDGVTIASTIVVPSAVEVTAPITFGYKGDKGDKGDTGDSWQQSFETVSKNLINYPSALNYTGADLTSIDYTTGGGTITKTFGYTAGVLTSITLSGDTPAGIATTKTLGYTAGVLTSINYS